MAWSIFSDGGGKGVAVAWAIALLKALGAPASQGNIKFIYDWEVSEGGGGKFNPLNQGPVPGRSNLTSTGEQYGGGAADFVSWSAGIEGAVAYLNMSNFRAIKNALLDNNPSGARAALIASPWAASHYGGGSEFSDANPPAPDPNANFLNSGTLVKPASDTGQTLSNLTLGNIPVPGFGWLGGILGGLSGTPSSVADVATAISGILTSINGAIELFSSLFKPQLWLRVGMFFFGVICVTLGTYAMYKAV
jgi:hypothetical protein